MGQNVSQPTLRQPTLSQPTRDQPTPEELYEQSGSAFFRLPLELRLTIYDVVFGDTSVAFGIFYSPYQRVTVTVSRHPLALLQTCRRMRDDIGDRWLGQVVLSFTQPSVMYETLHWLVPSSRDTAENRLALVRKVWLLDTINWGFDHRTDEGEVADMLGRLPGLQLDELTILAPFCDPIRAYHTLTPLVERSDGWKTLYYLSAESSAMLGHELTRSEYDSSKVYRRKPQPRDWRSTMERRDGNSSSDTPSVVIYQGIALSCHSVFRKSERIVVEQNPTPEEEADYGLVPDPAFIQGDNWRKSLLVVVQRVPGVNYQQQPGDETLFDEDDKKHEKEKETTTMAMYIRKVFKWKR